MLRESQALSSKEELSPPSTRKDGDHWQRCCVQHSVFLCVTVAEKNSGWMQMLPTTVAQSARAWNVELKGLLRCYMSRQEQLSELHPWDSVVGQQA